MTGEERKRTKMTKQFTSNSSNLVEEVTPQILFLDTKLEVDITKVNKQELLDLENQHYKEILEANSHLKGVRMDDDDTKDRLPVHIILGANDFAKIRAGELLRVGRHGDPVAQTIMSPGADRELSTAYLAINSNADYERLYTLDVLGQEDSSTRDQGEFTKNSKNS